MWTFLEIKCSWNKIHSVLGSSQYKLIHKLSSVCLFGVLQSYPVLACPDAQFTNVANVQAVKMYNSWYTLYSLALLHIIYCNPEPKWLIKGCETYSNCSVFHYWLIHLKSYAKWSWISPWEICLVQHSPFLCCKWLSHDYWHHPHCRRSVICNQRSVSCLEE